MKRLLIFTIIFCLCSLISAGLLSEPAVTQQVEPTGTVKVLSIPACAFNEEYYTTKFLHGFSTLHMSSETGKFYAPIYLPDGSNIRKIQMVLKDNDTGQFTQALLRFVRARHVEGGTHYTSFITTANSSGAEDNFRTFSAIVPAGKRYVNNEKFVYYLQLFLPISTASEFDFFKAKVIYNPPS